MLVLSRRSDERIMIGNEIVITVLEIHHDHVRIGIDAPRTIDVHREEVWRLVQAANVSAATEEAGGLEGLRGIVAEPGNEVEASEAPVVAKLKKSTKATGGGGKQPTRSAEH